MDMGVRHYLLASILCIFGCSAKSEPPGAQVAALGCQNRPCETSRDCCDGDTCTGNGICLPTVACRRSSCSKDADCCRGDYCAVGACAATVNLFLKTERPAALPGDTDVVSTFTVGNQGASTRGKVALTFATPPYVNISRAAPLPAGCTLLYENLDITVSEIVRCEIPGVNHGQQIAFPFHLAVSEKAPAASVRGSAMVLPVADSPDRELALIDNIDVPGVNVGLNATSASGNVNLFVAATVPVLGGPLLATQDFAVGNNGRAATTGPVTFTLTTAFFVNIDRTRALPPECGFLFENAAPDIPEIVRCTIPAGLGPGDRHFLSLPLSPVAGGPIGIDSGFAAVATGAGSSDVDSDRADDFVFAGALLLSPQPFFRGAAHATLSRRVVRAPALHSTDARAVALPPSRTRAVATTGAAIDLDVAVKTVTARAGEAVVQTLLVGNRGEDATGDIRMVYVLPRFANIDRRGTLPGACQFLYENRDFTVPEIVACTLPGLPHGATATISIPLRIAPRAPAVRVGGQVIVAPAPGSADRERFMGDNLVRAVLLVLFDPESPPPPVSGNLVDLYSAGEYVNILTNATGELHFRVGNKGPNATRGRTRLTVTTPVFVNIDRARALPSGCTLLYQNQDPAVPEIIDCFLAAGLMPRSETTIAIPVALLPGSQSGMLISNQIVRPGSSLDVELDLADNAINYGVIASNPPAP